MKKINDNTQYTASTSPVQFSVKSQFIIDENKRVLDSLDKQVLDNADAIDKIMKNLQDLAVEGREDIYNGNWARNEVEDRDFSELVPENLEPVILHVMIASKEWDRTCDGFYWRKSTDFAN